MLHTFLMSLAMISTSALAGEYGSCQCKKESPLSGSPWVLIQKVKDFEQNVLSTAKLKRYRVGAPNSPCNNQSCLPCLDDIWKVQECALHSPESTRTCDCKFDMPPGVWATARLFDQNGKLIFKLRTGAWLSMYDCENWIESVPLCG